MLSFPSPTEAAFRILQPQYNTPAYPIGSLQQTLDFCYIAYPQISLLPATQQMMAFQLAVCAELTLQANEACGYNGAVTLLKSRNDTIQYSLSKPGWNIENTRCGANLLKLLRTVGNGLFASDFRDRCCCLTYGEPIPNYYAL